MCPQLQSSGSEEEGMNVTAVEGEVGQHTMDILTSHSYAQYLFLCCQDDSASVDVTEEDVEKVRKAQEKIKYVTYQCYHL